MSQKKLSINKEQQEIVKGMVSQKISPTKIAIALKCSQQKVWRNMQIMGINKKQLNPVCPLKKKEKYFNIDNFKKLYKY